MTVTEFAFLHLLGSLSPDTLQALEEAQCIQDGWARKQDTQLPDSRVARGTGMLQQTEDPSVLLVTARWATPAAHWEWIGTEENKQAMGKLMPLIVTEGKDQVVLFHVDSVLFPPPGDGVTSALASPVLSIYHYHVNSSEKSKFEAKLREVMGKHEAGSDMPFRWGWRIEKEEDDVEELLMVRGWDGEEQRQAFIASNDHRTVEELSADALDATVHSYKRII